MSLRIILVVLLVVFCRVCAAESILVLGDSLSAGYGLPQGSGWVKLLEQRLLAKGHEFQVVNASISGETTAGGLRRVGTLLDRHRPRIVIIELGANDGLRGVDSGLISDQLSSIVRICRQSGAKVLLIGMRIPPNYGRDYAEKFHAMFRRIANQNAATLVPFMLEGFADDREMFQDDGIHPTAQAQKHILENIYRYLAPLLD